MVSAWPTSLSSSDSEHGHHSRRQQGQTTATTSAHAAVHEVSSPAAPPRRDPARQLAPPPPAAGCRPRAWPRSHGHRGQCRSVGRPAHGAPRRVARKARFPRYKCDPRRWRGEEPSSGSATSSGMASGGTFGNLLLVLPLCLALASLVRIKFNCSSRALFGVVWGPMVRRFHVEPLLNWWHCFVVSVAVARVAPGWLGIRLVARRRGGSGSRTIPLGRMGHRSRSSAATSTISALFLR
jgi:hypothetical protein